MKSTLLSVLVATLWCGSAVHMANAQGENPQPATVAEATFATIPVDSTAFAFSPGNWSGDQGRGGSEFRQTWNAGAYFRVYWSSSDANPNASLLFDTSGYDTSYAPPEIALNVDGLWTAALPCASEIKIPKLAGAGNHILTVYFANSAQRDRWGSLGTSGKNVLRLKGLKVEASAKAGTAIANPKWILQIGDSITEGIAADGGRSDNLSAYSYFVGQSMQDQGYEYGVSACGWSGWLRPGDNPPGDVPPYYVVSGSVNGAGGTYDEGASRWNKIDANRSLLDSRGHLSAYGQTGQEPAIITINYGTNDVFMKSNVSDLQASITQGLTALRRAAPDAHIFIIVPFGQYAAATLKAGVLAHQKAYLRDQKVSIIDLGPSVARSLSDNGFWGGVHPNLRGHTVFATRIVADIQATLKKSPK